MTQAPDEMSKACGPASVETKWYKFWLMEDYFKPKITPNKKPFVIIMPPPNVTGALRTGACLSNNHGRYCDSLT